MQLTVIGAHLPRLSPERLAAWIVEDVQSFATGIRAMKSQGLAQSWSEDEIASRSAELPNELEEALSAAALFEVLVEGHVGDLYPSGHPILTVELEVQTGSDAGQRTPAVRQQFTDAAVGPGGQFVHHVLEVGVRVMPIELGRLNQAHDGGGPLARSE